MPELQHNVSLKPFNTFGIEASAKVFTTVRTVDDVQALISSSLLRDSAYLIIGGGSNLLLTGDFDGLVILNEVSGIKTIKEDDETIELAIGSGENWHSFVMYCVDKNFGGVENLSLIPGTVGAAPMQNIGAYGVEIKDTLTSVSYVDLETGEEKRLSNKACEFGYRESIFKHALKGKCFISGITLTLTKRNHRLNTSYGAIQEVLKKSGAERPSIRAISDAVISIRQSKLPDPAQIGNAGSFFKNPSITSEALEHIRAIDANVPSFPDVNGLFKVPAGWLIEQCGWKGKTIGDVGVHKHQALVLVNYGNGKGRDVWNLAMEIQRSVHDKFNIQLQPEVNVI